MIRGHGTIRASKVARQLEDLAGLCLGFQKGHIREQYD
jgi:hypothetical protein